MGSQKSRTFDVIVAKSRSVHFVKVHRNCPNSWSKYWKIISRAFRRWKGRGIFGSIALNNRTTRTSAKRSWNFFCWAGNSSARSNQRSWSDSQEVCSYTQSFWKMFSGRPIKQAILSPDWDHFSGGWNQKDSACSIKCERQHERASKKRCPSQDKIHDGSQKKRDIKIQSSDLSNVTSVANQPLVGKRPDWDKIINERIAKPRKLSFQLSIWWSVIDDSIGYLCW